MGSHIDRLIEASKLREAARLREGLRTGVKGLTRTPEGKLEYDPGMGGQSGGTPAQTPKVAGPKVASSSRRAWVFDTSGDCPCEACVERRRAWGERE